MTYSMRILVAALKHISQESERLATEIRENIATPKRQIEFAETLTEVAATLSYHAKMAEQAVIEIDLERIQSQDRTRPEK